MFVCVCVVECVGLIGIREQKSCTIGDGVEGGGGDVPLVGLGWVVVSQMCNSLDGKLTEFRGSDVVENEREGNFCSFRARVYLCFLVCFVVIRDWPF